MADYGVLTPAVVSLVTTSAGLFVGYLMIRAKVRHELIGEYQKELRTTRFEAYRELWQATKPLAVYSPRSSIDISVLQDMSKDFRDWYFTNGLFLSGDCRCDYFTLQDTIVLITRKAQESEIPERYSVPIEPITQRELDTHDEKCRDVLDLSDSATPDDIRGKLEKCIGKDPKLDFRLLRHMAHRLRTSLSEDLMSRVDLAKPIKHREQSANRT